MKTPTPLHGSIFFKNRKDNFSAGKASLNITAWRKITADDFIIKNIMYGIPIITNDLQGQSRLPRQPIISQDWETKLDLEVNKFLKVNIIEETCREPGDFISSIFALGKRQGGIRMILNLKTFNEYIPLTHFKMESIFDALDLMTKNCYFYSVDLHDAFYSFAIRKDHRKYLKFIWKDKIYQYTCLPNGYKDSPRLYTSIMKAPISSLRAKGHTIVAYLDDFLGIERQQIDAASASRDTASLMDDLGQTIHLIKSILEPTQVIEFLGFILDSRKMFVSLRADKVTVIISECRRLIKADLIIIRSLASLVGMMVASEPAMPMARLFYRHLETLKTEALKLNSFNFEDKMQIDDEARVDLKWWIDNLPFHGRSLLEHISTLPVSITMETDASLKAWGAILQGSSEERAGDPFLPSEATQHINYLELLAVLFALKAFTKDFKGIHIRLRIDNTTAVSCINKKGSTKKYLHEVTKKIWLFALSKDIWISAAHIPGKENIDADYESRADYSGTEWSLKDDYFHHIMKKFGMCSIDLFASRINFKIAKYISWRPDPEAWDIDAFMYDWSNEKLYIFSPFRLSGRVLKKIQTQRCEAVLIIPVFMALRLSAPLLHLLIARPILLPAQAIYLPQDPGRSHPMRNLRFLACAVSSYPGRNKAFLAKLEISSERVGERALKPNTTLTLRSGRISVTTETLIL